MPQIEPTEKKEKQGQQPTVLDLPKEKKPYKFVIQEHIRGKSSHLDIRFEVDSHLIGFTLDDPGRTGDPLRFSNDAEKSSKNKVLAQIKSRQPKEWLKIKGEIDPGEVGATKFLPAKFKILDSGTYEMGTQKSYMFEVFLNGKTYKGRFIFRKLPKPSDSEKAGKTPFVWFAWKPIEQSPYVLSSRSINQNWIPPKGKSAMNSEWEAKIPSDLKWWEKNWEGAKATAALSEIRKMLLKRNVLELEKMKFILQKVKGELQLKFSNGLYFILDANPQIQKKGINAVKKTFTDPKFWDIKDGILEKGAVDTIETTEKFSSFKFSGTKLKGFWTIKKLNENFILETSQPTAEPKKLHNLSEWQIGSIVNLSKDENLLPVNIATLVGCSKETIKYWQTKLHLK